MTPPAVVALVVLAVLLLSVAGIAFAEGLGGPLDKRGDVPLWRFGFVVVLVLVVKALALVQRERFKTLRAHQDVPTRFVALTLAGLVLLFVGLGSHLYGTMLQHQAAATLGGTTIDEARAAAASRWQVLSGSGLVVGVVCLALVLRGSWRRVPGPR